MKKKLISVIIPMYNAEKYISKNINSILSQTYSYFELIIVNDGSTDNSLDVVYKFSDERINIISKENGGVSSARNLGLSAAKGDYVFFIDADDYIEPNTLEKFVDVIDSYNPDLIICGIFSETYKNSGHDLLCYDEKFYASKKEFKKDIISLYSHALLYNVWNKLFKREILLKNNISFPDIGFGEDCVFNQDYILHSNSFYNLNDCLYHYVREVKNSITTKFIPNLFDIRLNENKVFINFFKSYGIKEGKYLEFLSKRFIERTLGCLENIHRKSNLKFSERYRETSRIIHNDVTVKYLKMYHTNNFKVKSILYFYRFKSPFFAYIIGWLLHLFKSVFPNVFNKSKNRR